MTNDPDIRAAKSIVDYIFRWMGKKFLTVDQQEEIGILSAEVRARLAEAIATAGTPLHRSPRRWRWPRPGRRRSSTRSRMRRSARSAAGGWCGPAVATRVGTAGLTPAAARAVRQSLRRSNLEGPLLRAFVSQSRRCVRHGVEQNVRAKAAPGTESRPARDAPAIPWKWGTRPTTCQYANSHGDSPMKTTATDLDKLSAYLKNQVGWSGSIRSRRQSRRNTSTGSSSKL